MAQTLPTKQGARNDPPDNIADTRIDDERYRPAHFAAMLATLSESDPRIENEQIDDEPIG